MTDLAAYRQGRWCPACSAWAIQCPSPVTHSPAWVVPPSVPLYCTTCGARAQDCLCLPGTRSLAPIPPRQRSVVGTTLLVLLTVFVIAPILLIAGCSALAGLIGSGYTAPTYYATPSEAATPSTGNPFHWPSETPR